MIPRTIIKRGLKVATTMTIYGQPAATLTQEELLAVAAMLYERNLQLERWFAAMSKAMQSLSEGT